MNTQWPHAALNREDKRGDTGSLEEQRRMRTRYHPAERHETLPAPGETTVTLTREQLRG